MTPAEELIALSEDLSRAANPAELDASVPAIEALIKAAEQVEKSFSGSWLGYHSRIYYANFLPTPPGARFSQEWGLMDTFSEATIGDWREYDPDDVRRYICKRAGNPDLGAVNKAKVVSADVFRRCKPEISSILTSQMGRVGDAFLTELKTELDKLELFTPADIVQMWMPRGGVMTRDTTALGQRTSVPPHVRVLAEMSSLQNTFGSCKNAGEICVRAASHLRRKGGHERPRKTDGKIFIGHGHSQSWRELKDFISDRLHLQWDEFNRVPVAGVTNIARLSDMLDNAAMAFLVLTAEDELADGGIQARLNVVHEVGLFQGRLGFTRAIVLLEEGCKDFTNIEGLGQIRYPANRVSAAFEQVRAVLEREGLL